MHPSHFRFGSYILQCKNLISYVWEEMWLETPSQKPKGFKSQMQNKSGYQMRLL